MVGVVLAMMLLAILIAAIAPSVGKISQREREYELIFRGRQYARAIGIFQRRFGRYPNTLKELSENQPRSIRQLFKDPMCNCPDWMPLILNSPDASPTGTGLPTGIPGLVQTPGPQPTPTPASTSPFGTPSGPQGPIVGVRSKVHKESILEWRGKKYYDEWKFVFPNADLDQSTNTNFDPTSLRQPTPIPR
jgi:type II secretory pathway pseudopilin PulG